MARVLYCWRCQMEVPMLDEHEWKQMLPLLSQSARTRSPEEALALYFQMTGFLETNLNAIWHHRVSMYGPPCQGCGKPLRTPQAKLCAACGLNR
jgi:hypothetical protein